MTAGKLTYMSKVVTNLHFLLQKTRECGISLARTDLENAERALRTYISRGGPKAGGEDVPLSDAADMHKRVRDYLTFITQHVAQLAKQPLLMFFFARQAPRGSAVLVDTIAAIDRAERTLSFVDALFDPLQRTVTHEDIETIARMLIARAHVRVIAEQRIADVMGTDGVERTQIADIKLTSALGQISKTVRESKELLAEFTEVLGVCLCDMLQADFDAEIPAHWEMDAPGMCMSVCMYACLCVCMYVAALPLGSAVCGMLQADFEPCTLGDGCTRYMHVCVHVCMFMYMYIWFRIDETGICMSACMYACVYVYAAGKMRCVDMFLHVRM
jgi:hypothetical protein